MKDPLLQEYEYLMSDSYIGNGFRTIILGKMTNVLNDQQAERLLKDFTDLTMKLTEWYERASKAKNDE